MINQQPRPPLYLITGFMLGAILGLVLILVFPVRLRDVSPGSLAPEYKDQYRLQTALAFAASGDVGRALARIELLGEADPVRSLVSQAQIALADNNTQREARALAGLAAALDAVLANRSATAFAVNTPNPEQQGDLATPFETGGEGASYVLRDQKLLCENAQQPPFLQLFIFNAQQNAQAGIQLTIGSADGSDQFATGMKPEMGPGYAEYELTPGEVYILSINGVEAIGGLQAAACETAAGDPAWGTWLLLFDAAQ
ncbi:MAG: hypothetical protein ACRDFQ_09415 [Anaerolineales bacterium]